MLMPESARDGLDSFDLAILDILQRDNTIAHRIIGERVNLSAAAVHRRVRRMQENGVITGNFAVVDPARVGQPITIVVEVEVESERLDLLDAARRSFAADPAVQQCYYVTGDADFVLIVTVASMSGYDALTRRLFFGNHNVRRFRTLVVMDRIKTGLAVQLPNPSREPI
ncbi:AsnC family transcriptional regulator [Aquamicrobium defluvii]|uniref:AsnC family transcriptional regulator n=2 Tax=Aquamicrobium defluvii TaxID=69279 RepID=A0A4R6YCI9_9HYPH|nr:AsnC family transcriptional regulator [Aquamicrobium defluvii]